MMSFTGTPILLKSKLCVLPSFMYSHAAAEMPSSTTGTPSPWPSGDTQKTTSCSLIAPSSHRSLEQHLHRFKLAQLETPVSHLPARADADERAAPLKRLLQRLGINEVRIEADLARRIDVLDIVVAAIAALVRQLGAGAAGDDSEALVLAVPDIPARAPRRYLETPAHLLRIAGPRGRAQLIAGSDEEALDVALRNENFAMLISDPRAICKLLKPLVVRERHADAAQVLFERLAPIGA